METLEKPKNPTKTQENIRLKDIGYTEDELLASVCRDSFFEFFKEFWGETSEEDLILNWHIKFLCDKFQKIAERVFAGLPLEADTTVNISPGTSKSSLISILFPAWIWTRMPSAKVANISYAHDIATDMASKSRDVITSDKYRRLFPEIELRDDTNAKHNYVNTLKGQRFAAGIGGQITGKHFHFIIVDDPLSPEQAASDMELERANRYMERTLPSRKIDKKVAPIILVMQRLTENDPSGVRIARAESGTPHDHVCIPAELADNVHPPELRENYIDGLMDPVRLDAEVLERVRTEQGDYVLASQYGQRPIPEGTAQFLVGLIRVEPCKGKIVRAVRGWDRASTSGGGDYTVGTLLGIDEFDHYWVLDVVRVQMDTGRRERLIRSTAEKDGKHVTVALEREPGSGGKHSVSATIKMLAGFHVREVPVGSSSGDKSRRAEPLSTQVNNGHVSAVPAPWNREWFNEFRYFPFSKHDDQVDSASVCFNVLASKKRVLGGRKVLQKTKA